MTDEAKKYLSDILRAIELVESFTESTSNFEDYSKDFKTQSAVERQLGIVGEAVNKFKQTDPSYKLSYTREIIGLRNRLIHHYDGIDETIVWAIIKNHLPVLKEEVKEGLEK